MLRQVGLGFELVGAARVGMILALFGLQIRAAGRWMHHHIVGRFDLVGARRGVSGRYLAAGIGSRCHKIV